MIYGEMVSQGIDEHLVEWELYQTERLPNVPDMPYTGAFIVPFTPSGEVILMKPEKRGWGLVGGHPDPEDEGDIKKTLRRESLEEGGFDPQNPRLFAIRRYIRTARSLPGRQEYPADSYLAFYYDVISQELLEPTGEEVVDRRPFSLTEAQKRVSTADWHIIVLGQIALVR